MEFETETWRSMKKNYYLVKFVAKERVKEEILKIFKQSNNPFGLVALMDELNILKYFFPAVALTKHVDQPVRYHPLDVYHHTIMSLYHFQKINKNYLARLGILYHDVGKPITVKERNGRLTFYNHDKVGAEIAKGALLRLKFGKKASSFAYNVIRHHLRPFFLYKLYKNKELSEKAIYRFFDSTSGFSFHVLLHSVADLMATSEEKRKESEEFIQFIHYILKFYKERFENLKPLLSGKEIMEIKGFESPNECIGKIKKKLLELQALGKIKTIDEAIKFVKGYTCENTSKS